jgi:hypothetical protein
VFPVAPAFRCRECHSIRPCTVVSLPLTEACRRVSRTSLFIQSVSRRASIPSGGGLDSRGRRASTSACGRRCHRVRDRTCPPLLSGRYPASSLVWGHPTSDAPSGLLPVCRLYGPTPDWRSTSDLPSSRLCPVDVPRSPTPVGSRGPWPLAPLIEPSMLLTMSAPTIFCSSRGSIPSRWRIAAHQPSVYAS